MSLLRLASVILLLWSAAAAQKQAVPEVVLKARTAHILAEAPEKDEAHVKALQAECEELMKKWGRFEIVSDPAEADIVFQVRYVEQYVSDDRPMGLATKPVLQPQVMLDVFAGRSAEWFQTPRLWQETGASRYRWQEAAKQAVQKLRKEIERAERAAARKK